MTNRKISEEVKEKARKSVASYALYRPESAAVLAFTILMVGLSFLDLSWYPGEWWIWLLFGIVAQSTIILSTLRDDKFYADTLDELLQEQNEFEIEQLRTEKLQERIRKAQYYHRKVIQEIKREEDAVDDYLLDMVRNFEDWITHLYHLAKGLDAYWHDPVIARDLKTVPRELKKLKQIRDEKRHDSQIQADLEKTIANKQAHWETLQKINQAMQKTELQMEDTLTAMGDFYSKIVLLGSKDADKGRAQRLQADMTEQIRALEDISHTMDEVYHGH